MMPELAYAYYPGCTLHATAKEYDVSARLVCQALGIELRELPDWTCCGAASAHATSRLLGIALPARNLKLAQEMGLPLALPCANCFTRFKFAVHELKDKATRAAVSEIIGSDLSNSIAVEPLLKVLSSERIPAPVPRPLAGLRVACYYGCLLVRPRAVLDFDDEENPQTMDRLVEALGAEAIDWGFKTECCGASMPFARPDIVLRLSHRVLSMAERLGADCLCVACPMCHSNLDMHQKETGSEHQAKVSLPVLYFTQLIGLALGMSPKELLLDRHFTNPIPMLKDKGLV